MLSGFNNCPSIPQMTHNYAYVKSLKLSQIILRYLTGCKGNCLYLL